MYELHGRSGSPEHKAWTAMRQRCLDPTHASYRRYGGRGIMVCEEWQASFSAFYDAMGPRPPGHSLERIDNDGPYSPANCRWAPWLEQMRNTSRNRVLSLGGRTLPVSAWAEELGIKPSTIYNRLHRGWDSERARGGASR